MDFIMVPLIIGIITLGIYKLFELFVRKKERLSIIDKIDKFSPENIANASNLSFSEKQIGNKAYNTLKIGNLFLGVGLGLLVGFFIGNYYYGNINANDENFYNVREIQGVIYGASVMIFGGLSLLLSFMIELKFGKKN